MVDVLTWTIERRMRLTERAELLHKELAEVDAELGRLEAAEVVFGQWAEGDGRETAAVGHRGAGAGAGAGARRGWAGCGRDAVGAGPCRGDGTGVPDLGVSADHADRGRGRRSGDGQGRRDGTGPGLTPGKVEPVCGQLRKLADRGWLKRTGSGRYLPR
jgi:hypothetical protein